MISFKFIAGICQKFRLFMSVDFPTISCMAGCPRQYGTAGSLTANPCDAVLIKVEARRGSDVHPDDLTAISSSIMVVLSAKIDERYISIMNHLIMCLQNVFI